MVRVHRALPERYMQWEERLSRPSIMMQLKPKQLVARNIRCSFECSSALSLVLGGGFRRAAYGRFIPASTRHVTKTSAKPSPVIRASNRESICLFLNSGCLLTQAT
jgi:hypothetical protein